MIDFHFILLALYTLVGTLSFICGLIVFKKLENGWPFFIYLWSMIATSAALVAAIIWNWNHLHLAAQIVYVALCLIAFYSNYRSFEAKHKVTYRYSTWRLDFIEDVGITLMSLFDILFVATAVYAGFPIWMIVLIAVAAILLGLKAIQWRKQQYVANRTYKKSSKR